MSQFDRRAFLAAAGASAAVPFAACAREGAGGWVPLEPMPWPVQEVYAAVVWRDLIAVAGGLRAQPGAQLHIEDRVAYYNAHGAFWNSGPRLPEPRHHPMMASQGQTLLAIGGYARSAAGDWTNNTDVWALDLASTAWRTAPSLPAPQAEAVGLNYADKVHLITGRTPAGEANGGWNDQADVATHLVLTEGRWETARPCPMARNSAAGAVLDGALWVAGGRTVSGDGTGRLDRYDPQADRWDTLAAIPPSPTTGQQVGGGLAMAAAGGKLVAFGGEWFQRGGGGGGVFSETWLYDPAADRWEAGPPMRTPRHGLAAAAVGDVVYALAGGAVVSGGQATGVVEALRL